MSSRNPDNWRGGRKSQRAADREVAATPEWKRTKRKTVTGTGRRRNTKVILPLLLLSGLVALGVWLYNFEREVHTHFIVLDLLKDSPLFDATPSPEFPDLSEANSQVATTTQARFDGLGKLIAEGDTNPSKAQAIVVYLQTQIIPDNNGDFICLTKSSTPDVVGSGGGEKLSTLRQQLKQLMTETQSGCVVLLVVDQQKTLHDWRLGDLHADVSAEILDWPNDEELSRLVVMTSCSGAEESTAGYAGSGGQTAFGHFVQQGFSKLADTAAEGADEGDGTLNVREFCGFVKDRVDQWARQNRRPSGQTLRISPDLEALKSSHKQRNLALMKELPDTTQTLTFRNPSGIVRTLQSHWEKRSELDAQLAWRWRPLKWQAATEYLLRAQAAMLEGDNNRATALANKAARQLEQLEEATKRAAPTIAELGRDRGLPIASKLNEVRNSNNDPPTDVLEANIAAYPFGRLGLTQPAAPDVDAIKQRRSEAEQIASKAIGITATVKTTLLEAEDQLLKTEDQFFLRPPKLDASAVAVDEGKTGAERWQKLDDFIAAHQKNDVLFQRCLTSAETLARWAAEFPLPADEKFHSDWKDLLRKNQPANQPSDDASQKLFDRAEQLAGAFSSDVAGRAKRLCSEAFRLLVATRMLQKLRHEEEAETTLSTVQMADLSKKMDDWYEVTTQLLIAVQTAQNELAAALSESTKGRDKQVLAYQQVKATLNIANLAPDKRGKLIAALLKLDEALSQPADDQSDKSAENADNNQSVASQDTMAGVLWRMQFLNLFLDAARDIDNSSKASETKDVEQSLANILTEKSDVSQKQAAELGTVVRAFWQKRRDAADNAETAVDENTRSYLEHADVCVRGFSAFDETLLERSPTERLHRLWQADYCLLQADRLLHSQWVRPDDSEPWIDNAWYAKRAGTWLNTAEELAAVMTTRSGLPAFLDNDLNATRKRLTESANWNVTVAPTGAKKFDLSEQAQFSDDVSLDVVRSANVPQNGTAAVRLLPQIPVPAIQFPSTPIALPLVSDSSNVTTTVERRGAPVEGECDPAAYAVDVFFRGRSWNSTSTLEVNPCAGDFYVVAKAKRTETASVVMQGTSNRPIMFVLDMSESMKDPSGDRLRYQVALDTLEDFIDNDRFDKTTLAGLKVFGHRVRSRRGERVENPDYTRLFGKSIPPGVTANKDVCTELRLTSMDFDGKQKFKQVIKKLRELKYWGITPLGQAIEQSLVNQDGLNGKPGIVIAVTDGAATDMGLDLDGKPAPPGNTNHTGPLREALKASQNSKVVIVALDFQPGGLQRRILTQVFVNDCGIKEDDVVDASNSEELYDKFDDSLDPQEYTVASRLRSVDTSARLGEPTSQLEPADDYTLQFAGIKSSQDVSLRAGDLVRFFVNWNVNQFNYSRDGSSRLVQPARASSSAAERDAPRMLRSVLNKPVEYSTYAEANKNGLLRVAFSLMLDHDRRDLPVRQPAEVDFTFGSEGNDVPPDRVEQEFTSEWGAPGWRFVIEDWPERRNLVYVDAVWKMERTTPEVVVEYKPIVTQEGELIGGVDSLPKCRISNTLLPDGTLQVRLNPIQGSPDAADNRVADIRVEIGTADRRELNSAFMPDEVATTIRRTEKGSVIYEFQGGYTDTELQKKQIALTSHAARQNNAFVVEGMKIAP
ncbi:VWA domain-containing protein [Fuerstiella marisgermanici]|uniref:VWFA domain-containing protein n=1 Tax=Fuerstiella marisgermanici TaxID=1891926 RepID=A0A1P8WI68_9PLAN|nr:VWA domain-containing protein [Fuerstiella marisgermanici]APZ93761.1 hypothetical protein Fuma_03379 [Fuerstiella marisgermanici]